MVLPTLAHRQTDRLTDWTTFCTPKEVFSSLIMRWKSRIPNRLNQNLVTYLTDPRIVWCVWQVVCDLESLVVCNPHYALGRDCGQLVTSMLFPISIKSIYYDWWVRVMCSLKFACVRGPARHAGAHQRTDRSPVRPPDSVALVQATNQLPRRGDWKDHPVSFLTDHCGLREGEREAPICLQYAAVSKTRHPPVAGPDGGRDCWKKWCLHSARRHRADSTWRLATSAGPIPRTAASSHLPLPTARGFPSRYTLPCSPHVSGLCSAARRGFWASRSWGLPWVPLPTRRTCGRRPPLGRYAADCRVCFPVPWLPA